MKIKIKLLSVNQAWQGRRFKTKKYKEFEKELFYLLPLLVEKIKSNSVLFDDDKLELYIKAGLSSKLSDIDNIAKQTIDILQKRYRFNDRQIYKLILEKEIVKKGEEYLDFYFEKYN